MNTEPWKTKEVHPITKIIKMELIDNPEFRFNHISILDHHWVRDCNLFFPQKQGYQCDEYGIQIKHPDDKYSFFFWRDYNSQEQYLSNNPEYLHSHWRLFVIDGSTHYNYNYSIKFIIELDIPFNTLSLSDIDMLKSTTIEKLDLNTDNIKTISVNHVGEYERLRFKNSLDEFRQQTFSMTKTESDIYIQDCLTQKTTYAPKKTHIIIIIKPDINIFGGKGISYDPYSELLYTLSDDITLDAKFDVNEEADIPLEVMSPDDETNTDIFKRRLHYRRNICVWGLLDCHCTSSAVCSKIESGRTCPCGFDGNGNGNGNGRVYSLGTDQSNTLESRMTKLQEV